MYGLSLLFGIAIFLFGGTAQAAPQVLGLVATGPQPTPLHCRDGICSARFTSFCLQQNRDAPLLGTLYLPVEESSLRLTLTDAGGHSKMVPAQDVTIRSVHNYTTVMISIPEARIRELGGAAAALSVAPRATLVPKAMAGDPRPQTETDIALASGVHRQIAEVHVDRGGATADAASMLMTMINALHRHGAVRGKRDAAAGSELAHAILATRPLAGDRELLRERVDLCAGLASNAWYRDGMPTCLESYHDTYVTTLTGRYWDAVATGF